MNEIWKPYSGYEGLYEVSNTGKCRSVEHTVTRIVNGGVRVSPYKGKILKKHISKNGYVMISLSKNGKVSHKTLHRMVAETFIPNPNNYRCINHKDENKENNIVENLEWCTNKYNSNWGTNPQRTSVRQNNKPSRHRKVSQFTLDGKFVKTFYAASHAQKELGVDASRVISCCRGKKGSFSAGGFKWKYDDE